jgi:RND family efflux transporter MFP subunit
MRKTILIVVVAVLALAGAVAYNRSGGPEGAPGNGGAGGSAPGAGRTGAGRAPMPVEFATVSRGAVSDQVTVVGNLIGAATVQIVPKVNGRLQSVAVQLGDSVRKGQIIATVEDQEIQEQVRQAEASFQVGQATIRQREADLKLANTNLDRNKSLLDRQLLPQQTYDDTEARHQAALAQLDLARAQFEQAKARLEELKITLSNTRIPSPVDGFVGKRFLDPGGFVSANAPVLSVVDIHTVRLVANLVEKDVKRMRVGTPAIVEVDAYPGESFKGSVSRVAPIFDPSTRTAEMEIEVPNPGYRLKPGMYARVQLTVGTRSDALTVPRNAVVDIEGKTGVFVPQADPQGGGGARAGAGSSPGQTAGGAPQTGTTPPSASGSAGSRGATGTLVAKFVVVEPGIRSGEMIEILTGLTEGTRVVTTGAGALRDGDRVVAATGGQRSGRQGAGTARQEGTR